MGRRNVALYLPDEGGNRLGGSNYEVRIYNGSSKAGAVLATLYADDTTGSTLTQPLIPNAGVQTSLTTGIGAGAAVWPVSDTSGFQLGDEIPIRIGTTQEWHTIITINSGTNQITVSQGVISAAFNAGSLVGDVMMKGWVNAWVDDSQDYTIEVKNLATGKVGPRAALPTQKVFSGHLISAGATPTLGALQAGINSQSISGTDACHRILITSTGAPPAAGANLALVTYATAFGAVPNLQETPENEAPVSGYGNLAPTTAGYTLAKGQALAGTTTYAVRCSTVSTA